MTDYGHDLLFGTFLTPVADQVERVVALAELADQVGLDLVTVQDHPYQASFLDTWTLLSVIAARTRHVRVLPNVANLPLRPPVVLARSVASLDLLSGGRAELGLGAGAFWDGIAAVGGPRLTVGQGVSALEEGIGIIRSVWSPEGGPIRLRGEFYDLAGAHPGPAPAHDVGIWLGAYKPRMLRLTGRLADGWLPSMGYANPGDLPGMNAVIDEAALEAGRSPSDIRRLYNISPSYLQPERLAELTVEHGISAFILTGDDPGLIRRFAGEVAPAVRELVAAQRVSAAERDSAERTSAGPVAVTSTGPGSATPAATPTPAVIPTGGFIVTPTPDDGTRLSNVRVWDESDRPTGPAPDPSRTYTAHDLANGQHLIDVHDHLREELTQVRDLIEQVAAGSLDPGAARSHINTMTMRQNNWTLGTYCESYCRVVTTHHTLEDQSMFPQLRRKDPRLVPVVDRLEEEHHVIHEVLEQVDRALVALVSEPDGMKALREAVDLLTDTLLSHLSYEERELVEPLARVGFR